MLDEKDLQALSDLIDKKLDIRFQESEARMEARMTEKLQESETRMSEKLQESETRMTEKLQESETRMSEKLQESEARILEQTAHNMRVLLESYVEPKFKLLAEGHQTLLETLAPKSRVDELEEEVAFLKSVVRIHDRDIQELKKAQ